MDTIWETGGKRRMESTWRAAEPGGDLDDYIFSGSDGPVVSQR